MEYKSLNIDQLRDVCKKNNLPDFGKKPDLIKRLHEWEKSSSQIEITIPPAETPQLFQRPKEAIITAYLQIKATNISHYLNYGVIYPLIYEESEIYKNENRKKDIITLYSDYIIISNYIINTLEEDDALVEIITNDIKVTPIENTDLSYIGDPIPISRIKSIGFKSNTAKNTFISSFKTFPDFFFDEQTCTIVSYKAETKRVDFSSVILPVNDKVEDWKLKLKKFDKLMGLFSFMKNTGVIYAERENIYQEYTANYFSALSIINPNIKSQPTRDIGLYKYILVPGGIELTTVQRFLFRQIIIAIYSEVEFDIQFAKTIIDEALAFKLTTEEERKELLSIMESFLKLERHQIAYQDLLQIDAIKKNYPVLTLLFLTRFSNKNRQHTDKQAVRNTFIQHEGNLNRSAVEFVSAVLGLYYGYKNMIKQDTNLKFSDSNFQKLSEQQQSIKFRLASILDRVSIESIFNYCRYEMPIGDDYIIFNNLGGKSNSFYPNKTGAFEYFDTSYQLFNTKITVVERKSKTVKILDLINKAYPEKITMKSVLLSFLISTHGVDKKSLIELIQNNADKIDIDELSRLIDFDMRQRNLR